MNNGKICVSVCAGTADEMIANIIRAAEFADIVEVRFDCLTSSEIPTAIAALPEIRATYLFTFRPKDQGGKRELSIADRGKFWESISKQFKSDCLIDIEGERQMIDAIRPQGIRRIISQHDFESTPDGLDMLFEFLASGETDIAKIAVAANDITDGIDVWRLIACAKATQNQIIPISMGEAGKWTRILGLAHGAYLTYAALETGGETAPGQITAKDLTDVYRVKELDLDTQVFGVIGDPVSQSLSTYMHNPAFAEQDVNAVFIPFLVKDIDEFMCRMVRPESREIELNFTGFAVTMPHKQAIMRHLDELDATAKNIGAVNTVKITNGKLTGYNTDAYGFITPLKQHFGPLNNARVALFGAGGAARASVYALISEGAKVTVFVRDVERAKTFSDEFRVPVNPMADFRNPVSKPKNALSNFDIVVDTTPLGMSGPLENDALFTADEIKGVKFVYDLVTKPYDTPIVREAKKAGIPAIGGLEMLVAQGAMQFEIWTGKAAPIEKMRDALLTRIKQIQK